MEWTGLCGKGLGFGLLCDIGLGFSYKDLFRFWFNEIARTKIVLSEFPRTISVNYERGHFWHWLILQGS